MFEFNFNDVFSLADRRGLLHFLRSSHSSTSETTNRSRRTSRSAVSERRHSNDYLLDVQDHSQDVEHKRVIDSFVVIIIILKILIVFSYAGLSFASWYET
jgi:hypothetical protein